MRWAVPRRSQSHHITTAVSSGAENRAETRTTGLMAGRRAGTPVPRPGTPRRDRGLPHDFRTRVLGFSGCFLGVVVEVEDLLRGVVPQP